MGNIIESQVALRADLGDGAEVELEFQPGRDLWIATGSGVDATDLWLKSKGTLPDLRVRIEQSERGIEITVDRGQQSTEWWAHEAAPRLTIKVNAEGSQVAATASIGVGQQFQEVLLGQTTI